MSKFSSSEMERLAKLLGKEHTLYEQIRKLTQQQTQLLAKDDIEEFNDSLDKREELIEKIKGLHQESDALVQSYTSYAEAGTGNNEIDKLRSDIRELVQICVNLNDDNIMAMREKTDDHSKKIDEQSAKRKGIGGYAQSVPNTPEMFDKKT